MMEFDEAPFSAIDAWVNDHPTRPGHGWHEEGLDPYNPAVQQVRSELFEFLSMARARGCRDTLQIGIGMNGGTHFAFRQCFESVTTVEFFEHLIDHYKEHNSPLDHGDRFVCGCSWEPETVARVKSITGPVDMLFLDGGHEFDEVKADWLAYKHLVRPGGLVAFHDSLPCRAKIGRDVDRFLEWMEREYGTAVTHIGTLLGIAYYVQPGRVETALQTVETKNGFTILADQSTSTSAGSYWAVPETTAPVWASDIGAGDYSLHLTAPSRAAIDSSVATLDAAREDLDHARELLSCGDIDGLRLHVERIMARHPTLVGVLDTAVAGGQNSTDLLAYLGVVSLPMRAGAIDLLQRAAQRDPADEKKLLMVAQALGNAENLALDIEQTVLIPTLRAVVSKLNDPIRRLQFDNSDNESGARTIAATDLIKA